MKNTTTPKNRSTVQDANWANRSVFTGDNLAIMRGMNSASVDLIYLDPPFNSNRNYVGVLTSLSEDEILRGGFKDTWKESRENLEWFGDIAAHDPKGRKGQAMHDIIAAAKVTHGGPMKAYLCFMAVRLIEIHRILKPTGSVYLHCDPTASHYIKMIMDALFGKDQFRNEIVWTYNRFSRRGEAFASMHDVILFYARGTTSKFNKPATEARDNARYERGYHVVTDRGETRLLVYDEEKAAAKIAEAKKMGRTIKYTKAQNPTMGSVWADIPIINPQSRERTGWRTQKPRALLERIIEASSDEGDIVFDPFCGCATSLIAAEKLGREWVGCDLSELACEFVKDRIPKETDSTIFPDEQVHLNPEMSPRKYLRGETLLPSGKAKRRKRSKAEWDELKKLRYGEQEGRCNACKRPEPYDNLELDHIKPKKRGGSDEADNIQLLCSACNRKKGTGTMEALIAKLRKEGTLPSVATEVREESAGQDIPSLPI